MWISSSHFMKSDTMKECGQRGHLQLSKNSLIDFGKGVGSMY